MKYKSNIFSSVCYCLTCSFMFLLVVQGWPATAVQVNDSQTNLTVCLLPLTLPSLNRLLVWDEIGEPLLY